MASVIDQEEWSAETGKWQGAIELGAHGAGLCLIFNMTVPGRGPRLHRHPYPETFIVRSGRALFTVGDEEIEASAGQIVIVPAHTPHKFKSLGPDLMTSTHIHESGSFDTEWLE
ncbi:cupin domain-containing protein [Aquamicrobium sp. LC103]|uniref:cupin domain-containing protein n=1 Tax=Aquamicrobium sp. LC103 TaxID=1120658 RepID=UPI00063E8B1F|nr:cupin domain-containing protein [Aquamicrobium sp. LC103]TKT77347.1 cupin domain-containing protein [Aquamicrobium sp. LC103]